MALFAMSAVGLFAADANVAIEKKAEAPKVSESFKGERTVAYGDDDASTGGMSKGSSGDHFNDTYDKIKGTTITPNAGPIVSGGVDLFVSADFIYWYSTMFPWGQDVTESTVASSGASSGSSGYSNRLNSMDPGFKVAAGLDLSYDGWDTFVEYTWLHAKDTKTALGGGYVVDFNEVNQRYSEVTKALSGTAKRSWSMHFNAIDWELGRNFFVSPKLTLRPHFGLKASWQTHRYNIHHLDTDFFSNDGNIYLSAGEIHNHEKQTYWGLGIRGGLDTSWMFSRNWSIFGNLALAPLWGRFKSTLCTYDVNVVDVRAANGQASSADFSGSLVNYTGIFASMHLINMVYEFQLGFRFDYYFNDNDYRLRLEAAWEQQYWDNLNQFITYYWTNGLTMQGLTVKLRFDF